MPKHGIVIARFAGDQITAERADRRVPEWLRPFVMGWFGYQEQVGRPIVRRRLPGATATIMIGFGEPDPSAPVAYSVGTPQPHCGPTSLVTSMNQRAVMSASMGMRIIEVEFQPLAAYRLFGIPMRELAGQFVDLSQLLGGMAAEVAERLAEADDWDRRFAVLDRIFARRLANGPEPDPTVGWIWRQIYRSRGLVSVAALAEEVGWSRRHLSRRFRDQVGLPPKTVARLRRLQAAVVQLLFAPRTPSLADIAASSGFYDQAHLDLDFRDIVGCPPRRLLAELAAENARMNAHAPR